MKRFFLPVALMMVALYAGAQNNRADILQNLENGNVQVQDKVLTARLRQASRLFGSKDDLTSVIMVLPAGATVTVTGSDDDYYRVKYENEEGYIFKSHADVDLAPARVPDTVKEQAAEKQEAAPEREMSRFEYLENRYGTRIATQLNAGKIWKGMSSQMVLDSWGKPQKINRSISENLIREEWIYRNTWLYIENNILVEWGPVKR